MNPVLDNLGGPHVWNTVVESWARLEDAIKDRRIFGGNLSQ